MTCQRCKSERVLSIGAKCSDLCCSQYMGREHDGYAPDISNLGGGDYVEFDVCLECGQVQGEWPVPDEELKEARLLPSEEEIAEEKEAEAADAAPQCTAVHRPGNLCDACGATEPPLKPIIQIARSRMPDGAEHVTTVSTRIRPQADNRLGRLEEQRSRVRGIQERGRPYDGTK